MHVAIVQCAFSANMRIPIFGVRSVPNTSKLKLGPPCTTRTVMYLPEAPEKIRFAFPL
jgi:hypothetical protein